MITWQLNDLGKSWPYSHSRYRDLMEQWIVTRHLKFRSELLYHWALLLEAEGKLKIERIGQNPSQFPLRLLSPVSLLEGIEGLSNITVPTVYPTTVDAVPDVEDIQLMSSFNVDDDEDYQPPPESSSREELKSVEVVPEKKNSRKNSRASTGKKRKREIEPEPEPVVKKQPNLLGLSTVLREELSNLSKENVGINHVERFTQIATDVVTGMHMCGLVLKEVCKRNEEDIILVQDITCQIKDMKETRKKRPSHHRETTRGGRQVTIRVVPQENFC